MRLSEKKLIQKKQMLEAFEDQVRKVLSEPERFEKSEMPLKIGIESEVAIHKEGIQFEEIRRVRDKIIQTIPDIADVELGASQIEFRSPPINIASLGIRAVKESLSESFLQIVRTARNLDTQILRIGSNPFLPVINSPRSNYPRYQLVPDFHNRNRRKGIDTRIGFSKKVDIGDAAIVSLFQGLNVNLEAQNFTDAVDKTNRSLMIGPFISAISGNARFLEMVDTQIQDLRMLAWEISHDVRTERELLLKKKLRIGLPENYFRNIAGYLNRTKRFPFILFTPEKALQIGIGLHWLDTRIKFIEDSVIVEFRPISTQPTVEEDMSIALFFLGRLFWSQIKKEPLLPMDLVAKNRKEAMLRGLKADLWFCSIDEKIKRGLAREILPFEIQKAREGLKAIEIGDVDYLEIIAERVKTGVPSDKLANILSGQNPIPHKEMVTAMEKIHVLWK